MKPKEFDVTPLGIPLMDPEEQAARVALKNQKDPGEVLWTEPDFEEAERELERCYRVGLVGIISDAAAALLFLDHGQLDLAVERIKHVGNVAECLGASKKGGTNGSGSET